MDKASAQRADALKMLSMKMSTYQIKKAQKEQDSVVLLKVRFFRIIFKSARVAQWIRRRSPKPKIGGSSPPSGTTCFAIKLNMVALPCKVLTVLTPPYTLMWLRNV